MPRFTPVVLVENASLPNSRQIGTTLSGLQDGLPDRIEGPALLFFGEVYRERAHALITERLMRERDDSFMLPVEWVATL